MCAMFYARHIRCDILKVTQAQLAGLLGVDQAAVSRWEKAEAAGVSVDTRTQLALEATVIKQTGLTMEDHVRASGKQIAA